MLCEQDLSLWVPPPPPLPSISLGGEPDATQHMHEARDHLSVRCQVSFHDCRHGLGYVDRTRRLHNTCVRLETMFLYDGRSASTTAAMSNALWTGPPPREHLAVDTIPNDRGPSALFHRSLWFLIAELALCEYASIILGCVHSAHEQAERKNLKISPQLAEAQEKVSLPVVVAT